MNDKVGVAAGQVWRDTSVAPGFVRTVRVVGRCQAREFRGETTWEVVVVQNDTAPATVGRTRYLTASAFGRKYRLEPEEAE